MLHLWATTTLFIEAFVAEEQLSPTLRAFYDGNSVGTSQTRAQSRETHVMVWYLA